MSQIDSNLVDWDDLSRSDQIKAQQLLTELDEMFSKYSANNEKAKVCEDSTYVE